LNDIDFSDKKAILFDLDGTLIDSVPDLANAINHMLKALDKPTYDEHVIRMWVGNGAGVLVKRALSGTVEIDESLDATLFEDALKIFLSYYSIHLADFTQPYPEVKETLIALKDQGYRLAIVTNKPFLFIVPILEQLGMRESFEYFIGGDSLEKRKPDPEPLQYVAKEMGLEVNECIMIGDSKNDLIAAQNATMSSIGVSYGYNYNEELSIYKPHAIVDSFGEILKFFIRA
jgi:phosphoglycolate phosphatase